MGGLNKDKTLNIGDYVKIRQWDDMLKEYGYSGSNLESIKIPFGFPTEMKLFCGHYGKIVSIYDYHTEYYLRFCTIIDNKLHDVGLDCDYYSFSREMFEDMVYHLTEQELIEQEKESAKESIGNLVNKVKSKF